MPFNKLWNSSLPLRSKLGLTRKGHQGLFKTNRVSEVDYLINFDHEKSSEARRSILWYGDWNAETEIHIQILKNLDLLRPKMRVLDYGMGIGRIAKRVIEEVGATVVGVERSAKMRKYALDYVPRSYFESGQLTILSEDEFEERAAELTGTIDLALFVLVLQHLPEPIISERLPQVLRCLNDVGRAFVLGNEFLDIDQNGEKETTPVRACVSRHIPSGKLLSIKHMLVKEKDYSPQNPCFFFLTLPRRDDSTLV